MKRKTFIITLTALFCAYGVLLPQIFHVLGSVSGTVLLPMHLPVLLAGLCVGPISGVVVGFLSPIISSAVTGMPSAVLLPFMTVELISYGFFAGIFSQKLRVRSLAVKTYISLGFAQICGRLVRAGVIIFMLYVLKIDALPLSAVWMSTVTGLPGIVLQWLVLPPIVLLLRKLYKINKE